jgi:endonuclease YncB( thermonuclease family)
MTAMIIINSQWQRQLQRHYSANTIIRIITRNVITMIGNITDRHHHQQVSLAKLIDRRNTKKRSASHKSFVRFHLKSACKNALISIDHPPTTNYAMPTMVVLSSIAVRDVVMPMRQNVL